MKMSDLIGWGLLTFLCCLLLALLWAVTWENNNVKRDLDTSSRLRLVEARQKARDDELTRTTIAFYEVENLATGEKSFCGVPLTEEFDKTGYPYFVTTDHGPIFCETEEKAREIQARKNNFLVTTSPWSMKDMGQAKAYRVVRRLDALHRWHPTK